MQEPRFFRFSPHGSKFASARLMRYLRSLPQTQQVAAVRKLPSDLRSTASYKVIGGQAADAVKRMPGGHGHGSDHVFSVTRRFQNNAKPRPDVSSFVMPVEQRRVGTLGALLHDIGRQYENPVVARTGRKITELPSQYWHSESGARYAKRMLDSSPLTKFFDSRIGTKVKNLIRVHDTDGHKQFPQLKQRFLDDPNQMANRGVYLSDKVDGLGHMGESVYLIR